MVTVHVANDPNKAHYQLLGNLLELMTRGNPFLEASGSSGSWFCGQSVPQAAVTH